MSRTANQFIDPAGVRPTYNWPINHLEEQPFGKSRPITHSAPTSTVGLNRQQGDSPPMTLQLKGTMLTQAQVIETLAWWNLCDAQTIYFQDFSGDKYEVIITAFDAPRVAVSRNDRDPVHAPLWKWTYTISMEVVQILAGTWAGVKP